MKKIEILIFLVILMTSACTVEVYNVFDVVQYEYILAAPGLPIMPTSELFVSKGRVKKIITCLKRKNLTENIERIFGPDTYAFDNNGKLVHITSISDEGNTEIILLYDEKERLKVVDYFYNGKKRKNNSYSLLYEKKGKNRWKVVIERPLKKDIYEIDEIWYDSRKKILYRKVEGINGEYIYEFHYDENEKLVKFVDTMGFEPADSLVSMNTYSYNSISKLTNWDFAPNQHVGTKFSEKYIYENDILKSVVRTYLKEPDISDVLYIRAIDHMNNWIKWEQEYRSSSLERNTIIERQIEYYD